MSRALPVDRQGVRSLGVEEPVGIRTDVAVTQVGHRGLRERVRRRYQRAVVAVAAQGLPAGDAAPQLLVGGVGGRLADLLVDRIVSVALEGRIRGKRQFRFRRESTAVN